MASPVAPYEGLQVVNTDSQGLQVNDGSAYLPPASGWPRSPQSQHTVPDSSYTPVKHYANVQHHPPAHSVAMMPPSSGAPSPQQQPHNQEKPGRRVVPFGLSPWVFAAIAALVGVLVSGALVGGILGARLANMTSLTQATNTTDSAPETVTVLIDTSGTRTSTLTGATTTTAAASALTNYIVAEPSTVSSVPMDCPRLNGQSLLSKFDKKRFDVECGVESQGNGAEAPGALSVISVVYAYSLDACLDACAVVNKRSADAARALKCRLVVFHSAMSSNLDKGGNCFLKNATRAPGNNGTTNLRLLTATLVE